MEIDASGPPLVVYHVAAMGNWQEVVRGQLELLRQCDLRTVRLTHVGGGLDWILAQAAHQGIAVEVVRSDPNTDHYETFAMLEIERLAKAERTDRPVLYLHTKGVSAPWCAAKKKWRRLMEEWVVRRWRENLGHLADHDAVGVNWLSHGEQHFSGNFWIASPEWLRRLPDFVAYHHAKGLVRYSCENWIGARQWCRAKSLACADQPFWFDDGYDFDALLRRLPELPRASAARPGPPTPVIHVHVVTHNEELLAPHFLTHYLAFADRIFVTDNQSTDRTVELFRAAGAAVDTLDTGGEYDEAALTRVRNSSWKRSRGEADWVMIVDADELLVHPDMRWYLAGAARRNVTVVGSEGWDVIADRPPPPGRPLAMAAARGTRNPAYSKALVFDPNRISETHLSPGSHHCVPVGDVSREDGLQLLHFARVGKNRLWAKYRDRAVRMSADSRSNAFGRHYLCDRAAFEQEWADAAAGTIPIPQPATAGGATLLTIASDPGRASRFLASACARGALPVVLGAACGWPDLSAKARLLQAALATLSGVVVFADGYDSLLITPLDEIVRKFRATGAEVVFSAEANCHPPELEYRYPPAGTRYRFLNAGGFVGTADALRAVYDALGTGVNDQTMLKEFHLGHPGRILLDTRCEIFQCLYRAEADIDYASGRPRNRLTGATPCVLHGNGGADLSTAAAWEEVDRGKYHAGVPDDRTGSVSGPE